MLQGLFWSLYLLTLQSASACKVRPHFYFRVCDKGKQDGLIGSAVGMVGNRKSYYSKVSEGRERAGGENTTATSHTGRLAKPCLVVDF